MQLEDITSTVTTPDVALRSLSLVIREHEVNISLHAQTSPLIHQHEVFVRKQKHHFKKNPFQALKFLGREKEIRTRI